MGEFVAATTPEPLGDGLYLGEVKRGWRVGTAANGGFLLALVGRAMAAELEHPDPFSVNALYLAPAELGPLNIQVEVLRTSRGMSHALAQVVQDGQCKLRVTAIYTDLEHRSGENFQLRESLEIPPREECVYLDGRRVEFREQIDIYVPPGGSFSREDIGVDACLDGWMEFPDGSDFDMFGVLMALDAVPPPVMRYIGLVPWIPTLDLNIQVRARPAPGPLKMRQRSLFLTDGAVECDGELWDSEGRLVAISRQLQTVRTKAR